MSERVKAELAALERDNGRLLPVVLPEDQVRAYVALAHQLG